MIPKRIPASAIFLCLVFPATAQQQPDDRWNVIAHDRIVESGNVLPDAPVLIKSLGDAAEFLTRWTPPASAAEWRRRRPEKEAGFRQAIGLETLPERSPLHARILDVYKRQGYCRGRAARPDRWRRKPKRQSPCGPA